MTTAHVCCACVRGRGLAGCCLAGAGISESLDEAVMHAVNVNVNNCCATMLPSLRGRGQPVLRGKTLDHLLELPQA